MKFTDLNLEPELLEALSYMGFEKATPIQEKAIPIVLDNNDLIACAQTGTGKTGAFVLPILNKLVGKQDSSIDTLVVVPTRELAVQIEKQIQGLSYFVFCWIYCCLWWRWRERMGRAETCLDRGC
jgi:superfamily II DNA/RNA helicase